MARPAEALAGGRAPRAWRERTAAAAGAPAAWQRACAWLEGLLSPLRTLREGPLWGRTLEALTDAPERAPKEPAPAARRSLAPAESPRQPNVRRDPDPQRAPRRQRPGRPAARRREELPAAPGRRADRELLNRLAGPPEEPSPPASRSKAPGLPRSKPGAEAATAPGAAASGEASHDWFDGLGRRLRRKLRPSVPAQRPARPAGEAPRAPGGDAGHPDHPGAAALDGERASRTLLEDCLGRGRGAEDSSPRKPPASEPKAPGTRRFDPPAPPRTADRPASPLVREAAPSAGPTSFVRPPEKPAPKGPPDGEGALPSAGPEPGDLDLPSLLPRRAADFTPAAAAAEVLRLAGHRGPESAGASDGELAEKLGRILAEEARRHGIDV